MEYFVSEADSECNPCFSSTILNDAPLPALPKLAKTLPASVPDASDWTIDNVVKFFTDVGFTEQAEQFREQVCFPCVKMYKKECVLPNTWHELWLVISVCKSVLESTSRKPVLKNLLLPFEAYAILCTLHCPSSLYFTVEYLVCVAREPAIHG